MIKIRVFNSRLNSKKMITRIIILISLLCLTILFSNTLVLTNNARLYLNNNVQLLDEFQPSDFVEIDILEAHIESVLPIIKLYHNEKENIQMSSSTRWFTSIIGGFDIKRPKTIISHQILLMHTYDDKMLPALSPVNGSEILDVSHPEPKTESIVEPENDYNNVKSIQELLMKYPNMKSEHSNNQNENKNISEITIAPTNPNGYVHSNNIYIKNETEILINIPNLMKEKLQIKNSNIGPTVLIIHTHTSEAYTPTDENYYVPSDPDRTENPKYNVVRVGEEIATNLKNMGMDVIHDKTVHDYPSYNGSYAKTLETIHSQLNKYPSIQFVIDIHRDGITLDDGTKVKVCTEIENKKVAQMMFVVGTDQWGLEHPNWKENLKLALRLQQKSNTLYPNLARPINIQKPRYNQHVTKGSLIVEVGSNGNTLEEALNSSEYIARVFAEVIKEIE